MSEDIWVATTGGAAGTSWVECPHNHPALASLMRNWQELIPTVPWLMRSKNQRASGSRPQPLVFMLLWLVADPVATADF